MYILYIYTQLDLFFPKLKFLANKLLSSGIQICKIHSYCVIYQKSFVAEHRNFISAIIDLSMTFQDYYQS